MSKESSQIIQQLGGLEAAQNIIDAAPPTACRWDACHGNYERTHHGFIEVHEPHHVLNWQVICFASDPSPVADQIFSLDDIRAAITSQNEFEAMDQQPECWICVVALVCFALLFLIFCIDWVAA